MMIEFELLHQFPQVDKRSLIRLRLLDLMALVRKACKTKDQGLGMLCAEEASHRSPRSLKKVLKALEFLPLTPQNWLKTAHDAVAAIPPQPPGDHYVYVVLLYDPARARYGLYVGETSQEPKDRFAQHRRGYKAGRAAKKFGICLLPSLYERFNPLDKCAALHLEPHIVKTLIKVGDWVEGPRRQRLKKI